jgi:hypothetical protein
MHRSTNSHLKEANVKALCVAVFLMLTALPAVADFSVDLPVVTRVQGANTIFYTALTVTNNSAVSTDVTFDYITADYTLDVSGILVAGLAGHASFHTDDLIQYLADQGFLTSTQATSSFGSFLLNFAADSFTAGTEASAVARIYNYQVSGQRPSIGFAYRGLVLHQTGSHSVSSVIRNTAGLTTGPDISTNLGLENVGIDDTGAINTTPVTIQLSFYDGATGAPVGGHPSYTLKSGQIVQINGAWSAYGLPAGTHEVLVVATETAGTAQIGGYVVLKDNATNDTSFFFMQ